MTPLPSLRASLTAFAAGWQAFFFGPVDLRTCAAVRMAFAGLVLINFAMLGPNLDAWFGPQGICPRKALEEFSREGSWSVLFWLPQTEAALHAAYGLALLQAALLLVGWKSRFQAAGCFVWLVSFQNRNPLLWDSGDELFRLTALLLAFMPCGVAWSVDAWLANRNRPDSTPLVGPAWALKLLQIQMAVIMLATAFAKTQGDAWQNGTALYYVARLEEFFPRFPVPVWPFNSPWAVAALTWGALALEFVVPILIWFRETRRWALVLAVAFHLGCDYTMHLFLFHWIMLAGWLAFVRPEDFRWLQSAFRWLQAKPETPTPAVGSSSLAACTLER